MFHHAPSTGARRRSRGPLATECREIIAAAAAGRAFLRTRTPQQAGVEGSPYFWRKTPAPSDASDVLGQTHLPGLATSTLGPTRPPARRRAFRRPSFAGNVRAPFMLVPRSLREWRPEARAASSTSPACWRPSGLAEGARTERRSRASLDGRGPGRRISVARESAVETRSQRPVHTTDGPVESNRPARGSTTAVKRQRRRKEIAEVWSPSSPRPRASYVTAPSCAADGAEPRSSPEGSTRWSAEPQCELLSNHRSDMNLVCGAIVPLRCEPVQRGARRARTLRRHRGSRRGTEGGSEV